MKGRIIKGIAGFYYVYTREAGIFECRAKGVFRNKKIKPLVGDEVELSVVDLREKVGNVDDILPRTTELLRPAVANVDQALVIFAGRSPEPNLNLLDRFLCRMEAQGLGTVICFNKCDLLREGEQAKLAEVYRASHYPVLFTSTRTGEGMEELKALLLGRTSTVAGPSGVGKSSLINGLLGEERMETGGVSKKTDRGKHTTRHAELLPLDERTFIVDTPGFSSLELPDMEAGELWRCYPEFGEYEPLCRFGGCSHVGEPDCGVKEALEQGKISPVRYENYRLLYEEAKNKRKY